MSKKLGFWSLMAGLLFSCQPSPTWVSGSYAGNLVCDDCPENNPVVYQISESGAVVQYTENAVENGQLEDIGGNRSKVNLGPATKYFLFDDTTLYQTDEMGNPMADNLGNGITFHALAPNFPHSILFADWALLAINDTLHPEGAIPILRFSGQQNQVLGFTGCNRMFGTFRWEPDGMLTVQDIGTTKMFCENFATEAQFLKSLEGTHPLKIDGNRLELGTMTFKKQ